jgi:ABC-type multidrug transport system ATPase subunit
MEDQTDFIAYCIEEYKAAEKLTGREVIELFNRYRIINYIKKYYDALHVMGGLAITDDINALIGGLQRGNKQ